MREIIKSIIFLLFVGTITSCEAPAMEAITPEGKGVDTVFEIFVVKEDPILQPIISCNGNTSDRFSFNGVTKDSVKKEVRIYLSDEFLNSNGYGNNKELVQRLKRTETYIKYFVAFFGSCLLFLIMIFYVVSRKDKDVKKENQEVLGH